MSDSRRESPRYVVELEGEAILPEGHAFPVRTRNLSHNGVAFLAQVPVAAGTIVELRLALAQEGRAFSQPLGVRARIVWSTPVGAEHQLGASFLGVTNEQRSYLDLFLRYLEGGSS